ncbi:protein mono-ADP-ribosyltransferase PARP14-like isoform X2 [Oculina patagonica]
MSVFETRRSDNARSKSIQVTGLTANTTKDSIWNYFENERRSGGGEVETVDLRSDTGEAFVTFKDVYVVNSVLQQNKHILDGVTLSVTACNNTCGLPNKEEAQESRTIEVTGLAPATTKDSITMFFENTKRTGGGEVEHVDFMPDLEIAVVTFVKAESARGVVNKGRLTLDDAQLKVTIKPPEKKPPTDTRKLLVKGLSDRTTLDGLQCYMEVVSRLEVLSIEFGEQGCALVTFNETYDYHAITQTVAKKLLEGKKLSIEQVPVCNCVQVTGLNKDKTTKDAVFYFFDNTKNGGGVTNVELNIKEGWALVHFEDPRVVNKVLSKSHSLNGAQLKVKPHNPFLGKPVSQPDEHEVELTKSIPVDAQVMLFIFEHCNSDFTKIQRLHGVQIIWEKGDKGITVTPVDKTSPGSNRFDTACEDITSFIDAFLTTTTHVLPEAWRAVADYFHKNGSSLEEKVKFHCSAQQQAIALTGKRKDVEGLVEELQELNSRIEKKLKLEASKRTSVIDIPPFKVQFLRVLDFEKKLETQYEETQVCLLLDKGKVEICAPQDTAHKVTAAICQAVANIKELSLEMSQNAVEILRSKACQTFMKEQFTANNLQAALAFDTENKENVVVVGMTPEVANKASELVKRLVVEECLDIDEDHVQLDKSEKWHQLKNELSEKCIVSLSFDRSNKKIWLVGTKKGVSFALEAVKRFLKENTIVSKVVELPRGCKRFLAKYQEQELRQIEDELKEHFTRIKGIASKDYEDLVISGTTDGVDKAAILIQDLASKVARQTFLLNKPGMRKLLERSKTKKMLSLLENENRCVIEHFVPLKDATSKKPEQEEKAVKRKKKEKLCNFLTPEGKNIMVYKDNICDRNVDVIVNAANSKLHYKGGVAKAISDAAGEAIKNECERYVNDKGPVLEGQVVVTSAGKLPFKKVIHAVGPKWRKEAAREKAMGKSPREEKFLRYAVENALDAAKSFKSIAIPAISTGIFEFPCELCAQIMVDSALAFFQKNPSCPLSEIQFTSIDDDTVKAFVKEMDSRFLPDPNYESPLNPNGKIKVEKSKGRNKTVPNPPSVQASVDIPNVIKTTEGLKLVLVIGDMSQERVDVIVNSTSPDLDLTKNASSKALSAAAGPMLQQECKAIGNVNTGDIVVTSGGNLRCKHVFHTSCAGWSQQSGEQVLRDIINKCLNEAQKRSLVSVAIPAIGTGNLGYPRDRVAAASFDEVLKFSKNNPSGTIKEVHMVVYDKDLSSVQAFQTELQNRKGSKPGPLPAPPAADRENKKCRRWRRRMTTKRPDPDELVAEEDSCEKFAEDLDPLKPAIAIGSVTVQANTGDITKEVTDAIATLSNENLEVALGGGTGKAILMAGGQTIQAECTALGRQLPGSIAVTGAGKLQTRNIYHMVPGYGMSMPSIKDCIFKCLQKADSQGLTSISFPAVGTGNIHKGVKEVAEGMLAAISKFAQEQPTSLVFIRIVIFQPHMLQVFRTAMGACISSEESGPGFMSKIAGLFGFGKIGPATPYTRPSKTKLSEKAQSYLDIFAGTKQDIDKVVKEIEQDVADQCKLKVIEREAISKLSKQQKRKIKELEVKHDAVVTIEEAVGRMSIRGDAEDVLDVATTIHEILNQHIEEEHTRGVEELVSKNTQWFFNDDDGSLEPYDNSINLQIEKAFGDGRNSVIVLIDDVRCEIDFKNMKETCLDDRDERGVVRKEIGKGIPLPIEWGMHPNDSAGKEKEVHLVQLDPVNDANEYKKIEDAVRKTANVTITKIERVQNPAQYRVYIVRKEQMEQKNGSNEKILFHGTDVGSCPSINKFGFNRSYCGKNATMYGNGVYFARDASYSTRTTYSPPDGAGNRYMYLARVLAGEYTTGRQGMITPPPKGSDATDAYDTVVDNPGNPSIFVVFYDNQCYPDYLITFK